MAAAAEQRAGLSAEAVVVDTRPITLGAAVLPAAAPVMALEGQATPGLAGTLMQVAAVAPACVQRFKRDRCRGVGLIVLTLR
jgi:hypothetical protein